MRKAEAKKNSKLIIDCLRVGIDLHVKESLCHRFCFAQKQTPAELAVSTGKYKKYFCFGFKPSREGWHYQIG